LEKDQFRTRDHVPEFDDLVREYQARSQETRSNLRMAGSIPYGLHVLERLDLFFPKGDLAGRPVHMFVHGGYWRMFSKDDFSFIAETIVDAGAIAVIVDYALMPDVRMATIVEQIKRAKRWVCDHIAEYGGDPTQMTISGHSAGAHLCTFLFNAGAKPSGIRGALLLGGIYDLQPLQSSFLEPLIAITDEEVRLFTPISHQHEPSVATMILVGQAETGPFHLQAEAFASRLQEQGLSVSNHVLAGRNHMSSVRDLGMAESDAGSALLQLIATA
jgi:arylformamidase